MTNEADIQVSASGSMTADSPEGSERGAPSHLVVAAVVAAVAAVALIVRWSGIDEEPLHDELYNFLAARAWIERGELSIVPGADPYSRGRLFTGLIAWVMQLVGPTLTSARLISVFAGTGVATLLTWWLARNGLVAGALVAGMLVAVDPELMELSRISRFYAVQHLAFLAGTIAFARLIRIENIGRMTGLAMFSGAAFLVAFHLQIITIIGISGLVLFALFWPESHLNRLGRRHLAEHPVAMPIIVLALGIAALVTLEAAGILASLIELATYADVWAEGARYNVRYYYAWLHDHYAALVVLFPLLLLLSWIRAPRITALSLAVFGFAFLIHSSLAWKSNRYLAYALPLFFGICGIGVVEGVRWLGRVLPTLISRLGLPGSKHRLATSIALVTIVLSVFIGNRGFVVSARSITRDPLTHFPLMGPEDGELSWTLARPAIDSLLADVDVLVSSNPLKAVYFLDRLDYTLSLNSLQGGELEDFWVDPRFDRPVIIQPESLERIRCDGSALVLVEDVTFRNRLVFPRPIADYLQLEAQSVTMPPRTGIHAFRMTHDPDAPSCSVRDAIP